MNTRFSVQIRYTVHQQVALLLTKITFNCQRRCPVIQVDWGLWGSGKSSISVNRELTISAIRGFPAFKGSGNTHSTGKSVTKRILLSMTSAFSACSEVTRGFCSAWLHHREPSIPVVLQGQEGPGNCFPEDRMPAVSTVTDDYVLNSLMSRKWAVSLLVTISLTEKKRRLIKAILRFFLKTHSGYKKQTNERINSNSFSFRFFF